MPLGDFHLVRKPPLPQPAALEVRQFTFATAAPQSLSLRFNIDIGDTAAYNDLVLMRLEDGTTVDPAEFAETYEPHPHRHMDVPRLSRRGTARRLVPSVRVGEAHPRLRGASGSTATATGWPGTITLRRTLMSCRANRG